MKDLNKDSVVQGDNGSVLRFTITNRPLAEATVKVNIRRGTEMFSKTATIVDAVKGICEVTLNKEELMVAGIYFLQPTVTYTDNTEFSSDLYRFAVKGNLSYVPTQPGNPGNGGSNVRASLINGNIIVNGSELVVYDDGQILETIAILTRLGISANNRLIIDGIEQIGGGSEEMTLIVKDYFEGSANVTKTYADSMIGFEISNDAASGGASLTFTINGLTIPVKAGEVYSGNFAPYKSVVINSTVAFRAAVSASLNGTVTPPVLDTTAPTVTVSPNGGTFATSQQVTLSANETATIYYTLDGSTPTVSSAVYSAPITLSATTTLKYFAKDTAGNSSAVQTATFTKDVSAPPDTTPPNDVTNLAYTNLTQTGVRLTWTASNSSDVSSYEIFNGATNIGSTTNSLFDVSGLTAGTAYTFTVKAKDGATNISTGASVNVTTVAADTTAPTVTASPVAGTYTSTQSVTLSANETATIYYTTDGSNPTTSSAVYSTPISISSTKTLKYFGKDSAGNSSTVQTQVYTINTAVSDVIYQENNYLVMPVNSFVWSGVSGYADASYIGMGTTVALSSLFDKTNTGGDPIISTEYPYRAFVANMPTATYPLECSTVATSGSPLNKAILKVSTSHGATSTEIASYLSSSNLTMKLKLATGYKTLNITSNISNVTTRTSGVDTVNYEYFKCTLNDGIGTYVPPTTTDVFFASNGYEIPTATDFVFSRTYKNLRVNSDGTFEMLLPKGTLTSIDLAGVSAYLSSANIKIYYV